MNLKKLILADKELTRLNDALNRIGQGKTQTLTMEYICDRLCWLHRFNKCNRNVLAELMDKATFIMKGEWSEDEFGA